MSLNDIKLSTKNECFPTKESPCIYHLYKIVYNNIVDSVELNNNTIYYFVWK